MWLFYFLGFALVIGYYNGMVDAEDGMRTGDVAIVLLSIFHMTTSQCVDGVHNVMTADSYGSEKLPVRVRNVTIHVYDIHYRPSCHKGKVNVVLPGYFHIVRGEVETPKDFDLFESNLVRATVHLGRRKICEEGESGMIIIPGRLCRFDITTVIPPDMCRILQKKGIHTLQEMEDKLNFNSTLELPPSPSFLGIKLLDILRGEYFIKIAVEAGHERVVEFAMPSGFKALKMGLNKDDD